MKRFASLLAVVALTALAHSASAQTGITSGLVAKPAQIGVRAGFDLGLLSLSGERYLPAAGTPRYRAELALRIPIRLTSRVAVEPQLGIVPFDYQTGAAGRLLNVSATTTLRVVTKLLGPLSLVIDPVRAEYHLLSVLVPPNMLDTHVDRSRHWELGTFVGLRLGF